MPFLEVKCYMNHGCTVLGQSQPDSRHPAAHTKARKLLSKQREGMSACHRISSNKEKPQKDTKKKFLFKTECRFLGHPGRSPQTAPRLRAGETLSTARGSARLPKPPDCLEQRPAASNAPRESGPTLNSTEARTPWDKVLKKWLT